MGVLFLFEVLCFLTVYLISGTAGLLLNQALDSPGSLTDISLNASDSGVRELCTSSLMWSGSTSYDFRLTNDCFQAWRAFQSTDLVKYQSTEFEFLQNGVAPAHPGIAQMATPRRYVRSQSTLHLDEKVIADNALSRFMYNCNRQPCGHPKRNPAHRTSRTVSAVRSRELC